MRKLWKRLGICLLLAAALWTIGVIRDRSFLDRELIRFHVVANSDSDEDQKIKLQVRDAVLESLQSGMAQVSNVDQAKAYLQENLPKIENIANETLQKAGVDSGAVVSLCREWFDFREYDTFTLPAGVYESLRIVIGEGQGRNWWCVAFPELCLSATVEGFSKTAETAGMSQNLTQTLSRNEEHPIRFFFLDALGRVRNCFE